VVTLLLWCRWAECVGCGNGRQIVVADDLKVVMTEGELRGRRR
jgi:hypothetical protein